MSLQSAMQTGVSGILTMGNSMNVIGDNIANSNTIGFKGNRTLFADILANSLANGDVVMQVGRGVFTHDIQSNWAQGSYETTQSATDMAIQGNGFFMVRDNFNNAPYFTRAGQFVLNGNGVLVNPNGYAVQGYRVRSTFDSQIVTSGAVTNIDFSGIRSMPRATQDFRIGLNFDASASAGTTFNTSFDVYNNLGERITLSYSFVKAGALSWNYIITPSEGTVTAGASGTLTFDSSGTILTPVANPTITIDSFTTSGAAALNLKWDLYDSNNVPYRDITNYSSANNTSFIQQDGYSAGALKGLAVSQDGTISGLFSNGQTEPLYKLVLAKFISPWGLERFGASLYGEARESGQAVIGLAGVGGLGTILGSALELSNVDLASEFVKMIQHQRAYQASARVITTADDMLLEAVNLKR